MKDTFTVEFFETNECLSCKSTQLTDLPYSDREELGVRYAQCDQCTVVFARRYMTDQCLDAFYQNEYQRWYPSHDLSDQKQTKLAELVAILSTAFSNPSILDYGCGNGAVLGCLRQWFNVRIGVDYVEHSYVRECGADIITREAFEAGIGKFDVILLSQVLEHVQHPRLLVEDLLRNLKDDGILLIEVPGLMSIGRLKSTSRFLGQFKFCHKTYFNKRSLMEFIRLQGLEVIYADNSARVIARRSFDRNVAELNLPSKYLYKLTEKNKKVDYFRSFFLILATIADKAKLLKIKKRFRLGL